MISRLTFCAAIFAAVTTVSLAYAADSAQAQATETVRTAAPAAVVVLPMVEVTGKRNH
jgi:hypothetical protein